MNTNHIRFLFILFLTSNVYAVDNCCVDEDIAAAFPQVFNYSRDWPETFPIDITIEGFEYIASSRVRDYRYLAVAWKSEMNAQISRDLVTEVMLEKGWVSMPEENQRRTSRSERGFIPHQVKLTGNNQQFCRGRDGTLTVQARQSTIGTVVTLSHDNSNKSRDCAELMAKRNIHQSHSDGIMAYLPALSLPESIDTNSGSGSGGGGEEAHASMSVTTNDSAADISFYFEPQMKAQQWVFDSDFQGSKASGHVWRRNVDGLELICIVTVIESGNGLSLRMRVEAL